MNIRNVLLFVVAVGSLPALANSSGAPEGQTGEGAQTCARCHGTNEPAPTITVEGLDGAFVAGGSALFTVRIHSESPDGAAASGACTEARCAGFAVSTDTAGTFVVVDGQGTRVRGTRANDNETTHSARKPFDAASGDATFQVQLDDLQAGAHTLFVAGNDVNGANGAGGGDRVGTASFAFTVTGDVPAEGEGEGEEGEGEGEGAGEGEGEEGEGEEGEGEGAGEGEGEEGEGEGGEGEGEDGGGGGGCCSLTGVSPASSAGLVILLALLRRRRGR